MADKKSEARARELYQEGQKAYDIGDFPKAIELFKQSYDTLPRPLLLFNIAQAHRLIGQPRPALFFYQNYLSQQPDAPNRARVEQWIAEMKEKIAAEDAAKPPIGPNPDPDPVKIPPPDPDPVKIPPPDKVAEGTNDPLVPMGPTPNNDRDESKPIYTRWWLWTGVGVVVVGVAAYFIASSAADDPTDPDTHWPTEKVF